MQRKTHWENVYAAKAADQVSWFQPRAVLSLAMIRATGLPREASIIDIGGGASTLVDDLVQEGYRSLTVLDLSGNALLAAQRRLGAAATPVRWLEADLTDTRLPEAAYDLWHDRAVFHFLTEAPARAAYRENLARALKPGGHLIVAAFAADGPTECSGLPVVRYDPQGLQAAFGAAFALREHRYEKHRTPAGKAQSFVYCRWQRQDG